MRQILFLFAVLCSLTGFAQADFPEGIYSGAGVVVDGQVKANATPPMAPEDLTRKDYVDAGLALKADSEFLQNNVAYFIDNGTFDAQPIMFRNQTNTIFTIYRTGTGHIGNDGKIVMRTSTDEGKTQSEPIEVISETGIDIRNPSGGITSTGRIILFLMKYDAPTLTTLSQGYIYSDNNGSTWSTYQTISTTGVTSGFSPYGRMIEIGGGRLMISWYGKTATNSLVNVIFSDDNGATWSAPVNVVNTVTTTKSFSESDFVYLGSNTILGLMRNDTDDTSFTPPQSKFRQVISTDNGATWTSQGDITTADNFGTVLDVSPCLDKFIDSDGTEKVVCFYAGRSPLPSVINAVVGIASDFASLGRAAWDKASDFTIAYGTNSDFGYPAVVKSLNERRFLVTYYRSDEYIPSITGPGESYIEYRNYITDYALNQKANLFGGNIFDNGTNVFNGKIGVNATPPITAQMQVHNAYAGGAGYSAIFTSPRGGVIVVGGNSTTIATDILLGIEKAPDPKVPSGSTSLFKVVGNGNTSFGSTATFAKISEFNDNAVSGTTYAHHIGTTRSGVSIALSNTTSLDTDVALIINKVTTPNTGSGVAANIIKVYANGHTVIGGGAAGTDAGYGLDVQGTGRFTGQVTIPNGTASTSAVNKAQLDLKADLASPALTGTPTVPTAALGTNTTQAASTAFVQATRPYKVYTATLTQTGTSAPVAAVMENTLGVTVVYAYNSVGNYTATATAAFTLNKTYPDIRLGSSTIAGNQVRASRLSTNEIIIDTFNSVNLATDGVLNGLGLFEIRVYN